MLASAQRAGAAITFVDGTCQRIGPEETVYLLLLALLDQRAFLNGRLTGAITLHFSQSQAMVEHETTVKGRYRRPA